MTNEQLRMQMLSGIITEGEYKAKLEEIQNLNENALVQIAKDSTSFNEFKNKAFIHLQNTSQSTYKTSNKPSQSLIKSLRNIWNDYQKGYLDSYLDLDEKQNLNENFVGIEMVGNIFDREKTDYEIAFEYFTKGKVNEEMEDEIDAGSKYDGITMHDNIKFYGFVNISNFKNEKTYRITANTPKALIQMLNRSYRELIQRSAQDQYSVTELLEDLAEDPIYAVYDDYAYVTTSKEKFNEWLPKFPQAISSSRYGTDISSPWDGIGMATDI
jgi:hypothetical protein